jgi:mercuric ion binding protein
MKNLFVIACTLIFGLFASNVQAQNTEKVSIKTSAVCNMCKQTIEKDLSYEKGVKEANLDVKTQMLTVTYNPKKTNPEKLRKAVSKVGYDADNVAAEVKAYDKLDECCKKDKGVHE